MQLPGWTLSFTVAAMALLGSACGEVAGKSPDANTIDPNADFTLSVDPTSLTIPIAGSAKVTVTVARDGMTGDIALSAGGLGSNLTAEFSPAAIPEGSTTSEVTITVKGGTPAATSTVTLTGTAGDKTHSADVSVTSTTITVIGTVRGSRPGVKVGIIGKSSITSGAGGVFTFTDVTPPYDLYTYVDSGCTSGPTPTVYFFDDLTRPDPIVTAAAAAVTCGTVFPVLCFQGQCPDAAVSGTKSGTGNNTDPVVYAFTGGGFSATLNANGSYSGTASWGAGNNTATGQVHALQFTRKPSGAPNTFLGYVRTGNVTFTDNTPATLNLAFSAVNSVAALTGTVNGPQGYNAATINMRQEFGTSQQVLWSTTTTNTVDATIPLVALAGGTNLYVTSAHPSNSGTSSYVVPLTGDTTVNFDMPAAAELMVPNNAATGVTTTTMFQWTAPAGVISQMSATTSGGSSRAVFHVLTTNSTITLPAVGELPLPAGQAFTWTVFGYGPNAHINEAAAANELETVSASDYSGPAHAYTRSGSRTFTTQ